MRAGSIRAGLALAAVLLARPAGTALSAEAPCKDAAITRIVEARLSADREIGQFRIDVRTSDCVVTLSGCGTGLNVVVGGDELLGLVRGLLYAGAQGVLVTLWDVNDQSTADFMKASSLCSVVGVWELLRQASNLIANTWRPLEAYTAVAVTYLVLIVPVVWLTGVLEQRLSRRVAARA